jgi:RNA polymerase subunit RPABC4/transcription elongation factor Spt4
MKICPCCCEVYDDEYEICPVCEELLEETNE